MSGPARYRKKPVVIEAMRFVGGAEHATPIIDWALPLDGTIRWQEHLPAEEFDDGKGRPADPEHLSIETLEGTMRADIGDWIIRGVKGEFYPCKPDIFEATYEQEGPSPDDRCESCGQPADVRLPDGSTWCDACDGSARRLGYDRPEAVS